MLRVTSDISINEDYIRMDFVRSSGPGGQNVNKVSTAAQLRFDLADCTDLSEDVKHRLIALAGKSVSNTGILIIHAGRRRTQEKNRSEAMRRLLDLIRRAAIVPKKRRKTRPTAASRRRRLESKRHKSRLKRLRQKPERE